MAKFQWRDLPRVAWGPTFKLALARGVASGLVISVFMLANMQGGGGIAEAAGFFVFWALCSGIGGLAYQFFLRGMMLVLGWVPFVGLGVAILQFTISLLVACGDPLVFIVHKSSPRLLDVREFGFFNFETFIFVVRDENEETYSEAVEYTTPRESYSAPLPSRRRDEGRGTAGERAAAAQQPAPINWIETTSNIANDRIRHALEAANSYLDDATALVHPPTELNPTKADEIDSLIVRAREHLAEARAENETANESGVADYIELLDAGAEQYAGMAHALGRRRFAEGARIIERAIERLERIGRRQGQNTTHPMGLYLLSVIYLELGDKGTALSFIRRAIAANPDDADYRRLRDQIEDQIGASTDPGDRRSGGGALGFVLVALVLVVAGGAGFYFWQSSQGSQQALAPGDPNYFEVVPYTAQDTVVARESELNFRALPFARPDITVLRESVAGEVLHVTGLVNQPDGPWYQVRLEDGRTAYFKASLVVAQSDYVNSSAAGPPLTDGVYIQQGVCPFEGCVYRQWRATADTLLRREPGDNSEVIGTVLAGESVSAMTGQVHIIPLRGTVVRSLGEFRAGDVVYRLSYRGEGTWDVWYNGRIADAYNLDYWSANPVFDFGPGATSENQSVWWVQIQRSNGQIGWTRDTNSFEGKDQFG